MFLAVLVLSLAMQAPAGGQSASQVFEEANQLFEKRENEQALAAYERAIALDKTNADFHLGRCRTLARLMRHQEAIPACSEALRLRPGDPAILRWRGHFFINLRRFDEAVADLAKAEAGKQDDRDIYYHLGLAHYLRAEFQPAADAFRRCLALAAEDDDVIACSAWLYPSLRRAGREAEAAALLERITPSMQVKENGAYFDRLLLFKGAKSETEVAQQMNKDALSLPTVGYGIGLWHLLNERRRQARAYWEKAASSEYPVAFGHVAAETELRRLAP